MDLHPVFRSYGINASYSAAVSVAAVVSAVVSAAASSEALDVVPHAVNEHINSAPITNKINVRFFMFNSSNNLNNV